MLEAQITSLKISLLILYHLSEYDAILTSNLLFYMNTKTKSKI